MLSIILCQSYVYCQEWRHPFFTMDVPETWRKAEPPIDLENPVREIGCIRMYIDVRIKPPLKGTYSGNLKVEIFEHCKGKKLKYSNFFNYFLREDEVIKEKYFTLNNLKFHEQKKISEVKDMKNNKIILYHSTVWHIQGINRVYRITWGSYDKNLYTEELDFVRTLLPSFTEKQ